MVRLTKQQANSLLAEICASDPELGDFIKFLINLKQSRKNHLYSYGDQVTLSRTRVAGGLKLDMIIKPPMCGPDEDGQPYCIIDG